MIRTCVFRNPLLKSALKKDVSTAKLVRCFTVVSRCNRKRITFRNGEFGVVGIQIHKNTPSYRYYSDYPSHTKVTLPALSPTMESGTIISWEKKEGDKLNEGDLLAEIETDKATMGYETPMEGYLAKILVPAGSKNVPIGKLVCIIVDEEADVAAFKDFVDTEPEKSVEPPAPPQVGSSTPQPPTPSPPPPPPAAPAVPNFMPPAKTLPSETGGTRVFASPLAKRLAAERGISLEQLGKGSGIYGSITSQDLSQALAAAAASARPGISRAPMGGDIPLSNIRGAVAQRFLLSKQTVPHYYLSVDVNVDKILSLKEKFNDFMVKENVRISTNDFVIKAAALACKKVPEANSAWQETFIRQYVAVDVSVAVHTDNGLLTPVIYDADMKGLATISTEFKHLSAKAMEGKLEPAEYEGGTISIANLSMFGVKNFSAIINPPQVAILSVGATEEKLVEDKSRPCGFKTSTMLPVTLSCDHRVLDGAVGAQWLSAFRSYMEDPTMMML